MPATMHRLPRKDVVHLADISRRPRVFTTWQRYRHCQAHLFIELVAETLGVFFFLYSGMGSIAGVVLGIPSATVLQIGFSYSFGVLFALITCAPTSGGHFNPCVTLCMIVYKGFPIRKAIPYMVAQILGAYLAVLLVYSQWHVYIKAFEESLMATGQWDEVAFTPKGPAGIFAVYVPVGSNLGNVFVNEFVCDFMIGLVIWCSMDPTNFSVPPAVGPWLVSFVYGITVWGFSHLGVATNTARDLGARLGVMTIWGSKASGGKSAAIFALTNIPATLLAATFYEFVLADSSRVITPDYVDFYVGHLAHAEHSSSACAEESLPTSIRQDDSGDVKGLKAQIEVVE